jgi:hypothetical protein
LTFVQLRIAQPCRPWHLADACSAHPEPSDDTHLLQYIVVNDSDVTLKVDFVKDVPVHFGASTAQIKTASGLDSLERHRRRRACWRYSGRTDAKDFIDLYWILQRTNLVFDQCMLWQKKRT